MLVGSGGANQLHGMRGADSLFGEAGDDPLHGASGRDVLVGGLGPRRAGRRRPATSSASESVRLAVRATAT